MKDTMKKAGILVLALSIGQIKALEPGPALASLEVNLNQLFEPNIQLFYDSSLRALIDIYADAFGSLVEIGALDEAILMNKDADFQIQQDFIFEVENEDVKNVLIAKLEKMKVDLKEAYDNYQTIFDISKQKTGQPEKANDVSLLANYLVSPLEQVIGLITVKPEPEPEVKLLFEGFGTIEAQAPVADDDAAALKAKYNAIDMNDYDPTGKADAEIKKAINTLIVLYSAMKTTDAIALGTEIVGLDAYFGINKDELTEVDQATAKNAWDAI